MRIMLHRVRAWARSLKTETYALYLAARDPRTPWYARLLAGFVVAYAFSPIDLIPDFVPVLGYLDDLLIVPLGIALALRMIPAAVLADSRARAATMLESGKPTQRTGLAMVITIWLLVIALLAWLVLR